MDTAKRDALLRQINYAGNYDCFPVAVTLEQFFGGNDDLGSIWCNLENQPESMEAIHDFLKDIRARADVSDVKILVTQYDGGSEEWPFSDTVVIDTEVDPEEVSGWFEEFSPDEVEYADREVKNLAGFRNCVAVWWD